MEELLKQMDKIVSDCMDLQLEMKELRAKFLIIGKDGPGPVLKTSTSKVSALESVSELSNEFKSTYKAGNAPKEVKARWSNKEFMENMYSTDYDHEYYNGIVNWIGTLDPDKDHVFEVDSMTKDKKKFIPHLKMHIERGPDLPDYRLTEFNDDYTKFKIRSVKGTTNFNK